MEKTSNTKKVFLENQESIFSDLCSLAIQSVLVGKMAAHTACCVREEEFPMKDMFDEWFTFLDKNMKNKSADWPSVYDGFLEIGFRHLTENESGLWSSWDTFSDIDAEPST